MEKKVTGLLGTVAVLALSAPASAAALPPAHDPVAVRSYAELLDPVPNAAALLRADDNVRDVQGTVRLARWHHHHHHHHHRWYRRNWRWYW